jgi:hypothetical protein
VGGALGVAVIGTILATRYASNVDPYLTDLPAGIPEQAKEVASQSIVGTVSVLDQASALPSATVDMLRAGAFEAFLNATHITAWISAAVVLVSFLVVLFALPDITPPQRVPITAPEKQPNPGSTDINAVIEAEFSHYSEEASEELAINDPTQQARPHK